MAFGLGALNAAQRTSERAAVTILAKTVPRCELAGRVLETAGGLGTLVAVELARCEGFEPAHDPGVVVVDDLTEDAGAGMSGRGWLLPVGRDSFGRARARLGADAVFDPRDVDFSPPRAPPLAVAAAVRGGLRAATTPLQRRRGALLRGLAIGDTSELDPATMEAFRRAGLSHLLAVSGSNVAIVLGALALALASVALRVRLAVAFLGLALFVLVVGPEPSVLRAAAMGGVGLLALTRGRRADALHALGLAGIVVVGARPEMVFSTGLHLSAAATAGIVLWTQPLARRLRSLPRPVSAALAATLSAQLAVAPILVAAFGQLSLVAPAANLIAFPAVAPATILSLAAGVLAPIWGAAAGVLARGADPFAAWVLVVADRFGLPEWAAVEISETAAYAVALPVLVAAALTLRRYSRS